MRMECRGVVLARGGNESVKSAVTANSAKKKRLRRDRADAVRFVIATDRL